MNARMTAMDPQSLMIDKLAAHEEILFALLFGSRARGDERPGSDWDVGAYLDDRLGPEKRFELRLRLHAELQEAGCVDLVVLNDAPPLLAHRALQGIRLIVRDRSAYVRFFVRTAARAGDEQFWRSLHARARARRLEEGKFGRP
ncbi:MAG: hypothetical protein GF355_08180 [Candidatus Eisenbacteria bacterium]|nr:hypothetical protein [Candidatus Eisenbacteria bacterium]